MLAYQKSILAQSWEVTVATIYDTVYASLLSRLIAEANQEPGVALALRTPQYIAAAMKEGHAVIAHNSLGEAVGFCVIKLWDGGKYISHSGLVVKPAYRKQGIGTAIIRKLNQLCAEKYPHATLFSLTESSMVITTRLAMGFHEAPYSCVTSDPAFWAGCQTCPHYDLFQKNLGQTCLCKVLVKEPPYSLS